MDAYEAEVWAEIQRYRERQHRFKLRRLIPENVREKAREIGSQSKELAGELPGAEQVQTALRAAVDGLSKGVMATALATLREGPVLDRFSGNGREPTELREIRNLHLREADRAF